MSHSSRRHRRLRAAAAFLALPTAVAAAIPAAMAYADPAPADLVLGVSVTPTALPVAGGAVTARIELTNRGGAVADGISLTLQYPFVDRMPAGEGSSWQCGPTRPTVTCTYAALAAGQSAVPLEFPIDLTAGSDGQKVKVTGTVSTSSKEVNTSNNSGRATITYDADVIIPALSFSRTILEPDSYVVPGDFVRVGLEVRNSGSLASDVVVRLVAPPALADAWGRSDRSDPAWECMPLSTPGELECRHGPLATGATTGMLYTVAQRVPDGTPGELLPITATVSTSTPGDDPSDNTYSGGFEYAPRTIIRGQFFEDTDQDGQRDPGETNVATGAGAFLVPLVFGSDVLEVDLNADGSFNKWVLPDTYRLETSIDAATWRYTEPDVGDDATDSDVYHTGTDDAANVHFGQSQEFTIDSGGEVVVDIGVIRVG